MPDQHPTGPEPVPETAPPAPLYGRCGTCSRTTIERPDLTAGVGHAVREVDDYHTARPVPGQWAADAPDWQFRVTTYYADDVPPPQVGGETCVQTYHVDELGADIAVADGTAMPEVGAMLVERRTDDDVARADPRASWSSLRRWTRTPEGWEHS